MLLGIRPEHLHVRPVDASNEHAEGPTIETRIRRVEFQGDSVLLSLDIAGASAVARVPVRDDYDYNQGQGVSVSPDLGRAAWFPVERRSSEPTARPL